MKPPLRPENDEGYLELIEGPMQDKSSLSTGPANATALGDVDDVLMLTVRSRGEPFVGKFNTTTTESQVAEVIYFCAPAINTAGSNTDSVLYFNGATPIRTATLYRRVLLVNPGLKPNMSTITPGPTYYDLYDVSARLAQDSTNQTRLVPNSLGDLTKREFRYAHLGTAYPAVFPFDVATTMPSGHLLYDAAVPQKGALAAFRGDRLSDDVLLTNVLSFDVQVYDPSAPVQATATAAFTPSDPGFSTASIAGAYADLGSNYPAVSGFPDLFNQAAIPLSATTLTPLIPASAFPYAVVGNPRTYDTWSRHYESYYENPPGTVVYHGRGTDGLDNDNNGIVDDVAEYQTQPPFAAQLRGIRITIRVYEPSSQQVRQMTVVGDFLPD
jgi:hypothetical protein